MKEVARNTSMGDNMFKTKARARKGKVSGKLAMMEPEPENMNGGLRNESHPR